MADPNVPIDPDIEAQLKAAAAQKGVQYDRSDAEDIAHRDNSPEALQMALRKYDTRASNTPNAAGGGNGNQTPAQSWNSAPQQTLFPDWYRELMTRNVSLQEQQAAENKSRADALYGTLNQRASQGLAVSPTDATIRPQVDAFRAEQDRASRNYLGDLAEKAGPLANLRGEQRLASEKVGQATSGFQAQLMGRELQARRDEIAQALASQGALLSGDQQRNLQQQLAQLDQAIKEANVGLGAGDLALRGELGRGGLDIQRQGLALQGQALGQSGDQFQRELALRAWQAGDQSALNWASL